MNSTAHVRDELPPLDESITASDKLPPLVPITVCAAYLHVGRNTVRRMIARGDLEAVRVGPKLLRIKRASIEALGR